MAGHSDSVLNKLVFIREYRYNFDMGKYLNAPIEEAVFDIRIDPALAIEGMELETILYPKVSERYPLKETMRIFEMGGEFKAGELAKSHATDKGAVGFRASDRDKKQVCTFRRDGFSFSRLRPYSDWEGCFLEAKGLWDIYKKEFNPQSIKRVAVRFVNVIKIPLARFELEDYFYNSPRPPEGLPENLVEFASRLRIRYDDNYHAVIILALQSVVQPGFVPILLDIDAFSEVPFVVGDEERLNKVFERLHDIKNDIFEKSITDKTRDIII